MLAFNGSRQGKSDTGLLANFIITKELQRNIRSLAIRIRTRWAARHVLDRSGAWDRGALRRNETDRCSGRVLSRSGSSSVCRGVYRFGFETLRKLADTGAKLVGDATAAIAYRDVARA